MTESTLIVIFGASGDLTRRKLIPALYNLYLKKRMPANFTIVGVSRSPLLMRIFALRSNLVCKNLRLNDTNLNAGQNLRLV